MIHIVGSSRYKVDKKAIRKQIDPYLPKVGLDPTGIINIILVGKRKMTQIASTYKHENVALPVLSFTFNETTDPDEHLIGEIYICYPQAVLLAAERGKRVEETFQWLIEHGIRNLVKG
jgi:rRNA maturation RNase YbeY